MHFLSAGFCDKKYEGPKKKEKNNTITKKRNGKTSVINHDMQVSHGATHGVIILIFILGDYLDSLSRLLLAEYIAKSRFTF